MTNITVRQSSPPPPNPNTMRMRGVSAAVAAALGVPSQANRGTPVMTNVTGDALGPGKCAVANISVTTAVAGLATSPINPDSPVDVQYDGPFSMPAEEWEAIVDNALPGADGLRPGNFYYLSSTGRLINTALSTAIPIGYAISTTTLNIQLSAIIPQP